MWLSDHLFLDTSKYGGPVEPVGAMELFTTLAALSEATNRVRIGSLVACNGLRHPALVAKMAATIDVLSEGRLHLGMGAGWYEPEFAAAGVPFEAAGVRVRRLEEAVQVVGGMLSNETFSFEGTHYSVKEALLRPRPIQLPRPPVWVGGKGDRVVSIAGRFADGFNTVWAWTPDAFRGRVGVLNRAARKAGRDPSSIRKSVGLYVLPAEDARDLESRWGRYVAASPPGTGDMDAREWMADKLAGNPTQILTTLSAFAELGVEEVILGFGILPFQIADEESVEWFVREVFPLTKKAEGE